MGEELTQEKVDHRIPDTKEEVVVLDAEQAEDVPEVESQEEVQTEECLSDQVDEDENTEPKQTIHQKFKKRNPKFTAQWKKTYFRRGDSYEEDMELSREDYILTRVPDSDLMEYLRMEREKNEKLQLAREEREKRIFKMLQMILLFATIIAVVGLLREQPLVLVNILYIAGITLGIWFFKKK